MHLKPVGDALRQALLNRNRLKPARIIREARRRRSPENLPTSECILIAALMTDVALRLCKRDGNEEAPYGES